MLGKPYLMEVVVRSPETPDSPPPANRAAERARTLAASQADVTLIRPGMPPIVPIAHQVDETGRPLLMLPEQTGAEDSPAVLEYVDVGPVAVLPRVRGRAWLAGWLEPVSERERAGALITLAEDRPAFALQAATCGEPPLRLRISEVALASGGSTTLVEPAAYHAASEDPLARIEADLVGHLDRAHRAELTLICQRVGGRTGELAATVRPIALDRFGLRLRLGARPDERFDVRLEFPEPVRTPADLRSAFRQLLDGVAYRCLERG